LINLIILVKDLGWDHLYEKGIHRIQKQHQRNIQSGKTPRSSSEDGWMADKILETAKSRSITVEQN
jgi:hypothetical protein